MDLGTIATQFSDFGKFATAFVDFMQGFAKMFGTFAEWNADRAGDGKIVDNTDFADLSSKADTEAPA